MTKTEHVVNHWIDPAHPAQTSIDHGIRSVVKSTRQGSLWWQSLPETETILEDLDDVPEMVYSDFRRARIVTPTSIGGSVGGR